MKNLTKIVCDTFNEEEREKGYHSKTIISMIKNAKIPLYSRASKYHYRDFDDKLEQSLFLLVEKIVNDLSDTEHSGVDIANTIDKYVRIGKEETRARYDWTLSSWFSSEEEFKEDTVKTLKYGAKRYHAPENFKFSDSAIEYFMAYRRHRDHRGVYSSIIRNHIECSVELYNEIKDNIPLMQKIDLNNGNVLLKLYNFPNCYYNVEYFEQLEYCSYYNIFKSKEFTTELIKYNKRNNK